MTDSRYDVGDDVRDTVLAAGLPPDATFTADLRARLAAVASGDIELEPRRADRSRPWVPFVAAAAVVALVVGAIALIARERDPDVVPASDLRVALVGSTWVALDADTGAELPTLEMKIGTTRPDVLILRGTDGCTEHSGEFRLDGSTVVDATIVTELVPCATSAVMPHDGATVSIADDVLTVTDDGGSAAFTAIESLPVVTGSQLDGEWAYANGSLTIADGQVTTPADVDGTAIDLTRALAVGSAEAWAYGDSLVFRTPTTGFRRLDPATVPGGATLLDQLVGRTWVGVDGPWATTSPTLVFDSLNREPGLSALTIDDGCNSGGGSFRLAGDMIVASEIAVEARGCAHEIAHLTDGTTLAVTDAVLTVTGGPTTTFVALDSLEAAAPSLDGTWLVGDATFSIAGDQVTSADATSDPDTAVQPIDVLSAAVGATVEAWRYGDGWIVHGADHYVQVAPAGPPAATAGPVVTTGPLDAAEEALIEGTLALIDGCLAVGINETMFVLVWQPGTTWDAATEQVVLPGGRRAAVGDVVRGGGGYHAVADLGVFGVDDAGIAAVTLCADRLGPEVAVIQSPVDIIGAPVADPAVPDGQESVRTYHDDAAAVRYAAAGTPLVSAALESERRSGAATCARCCATSWVSTTSAARSGRHRRVGAATATGR